MFSEFTRLANDYSAVNLGQGFPTLPVAEFILAGAARAMQDACMLHQYTRSEGHPRLVKGGWGEGASVFIHRRSAKQERVLIAELQLSPPPTPQPWPRTMGRAWAGGWMP